jgi:uncharacterized protein YacL
MSSYNLPVGNSQEPHAINGPRPAPPRRRRTDKLASGRVKLLLAKLLSTLVGALVGFFVAHLISIIFAGPFHKLVADASSNLAGARQLLTEKEPDYTRARDDYWRLKNMYEDSAAAGSASPTYDSGKMDRLGPPQALQANPQAKAQLDQAYKDYSEKRKLRDKTQKDIDFWEAQILEYRGNINQLDLLSGAVVLILILIGYAMHPLMLLGIEHTGNSWSEFFAGPEPRTNQAVIGFFAGLIVAIVVLLAIFNVFAQGDSAFNSPPVRLLFGAFVVVVLGIAGALIGVTYFAPPSAADDIYADFRRLQPPHLLDTSVVIDGRVPDIAATGFIGGTLVVTNSVLRELQNMADSADERKRAKGRRGLELLRKMQDDPRLDLRVFDDLGFDMQAHGTDEQLILVAQAMDGVVVTNDYNLNRVAAIRDVRVININALANAVKTNHLPGDTIDVYIIDRGKQRGQGVAYLDDGTMVVVEDGEPHLRQSKLVKLTSVTQTVQGRLIFGRVDLAEEDQQGNGH